MIKYETRINMKELGCARAPEKISQQRPPSSTSEPSVQSIPEREHSESIMTYFEPDLINYFAKQVAKLPKTTCDPFKDNLELTKLEILEVSMLILIKVVSMMKIFFFVSSC